MHFNPRNWCAPHSIDECIGFCLKSTFVLPILIIKKNEVKPNRCESATSFWNVMVRIVRSSLLLIFSRQNSIQERYRFIEKDSNKRKKFILYPFEENTRREIIFLSFDRQYRRFILADCYKNEISDNLRNEIFGCLVTCDSTPIRETRRSFRSRIDMPFCVLTKSIYKCKFMPQSCD